MVGQHGANDLVVAVEPSTSVNTMVTTPSGSSGKPPTVFSKLLLTRAVIRSSSCLWTSSSLLGTGAL
jgi:hypothetical protein